MSLLSVAAPMSVSLPGLFDAHAHFRQGAVLPGLVKAHVDMGCFGAVAMPNTQPPVTKVVPSDPGEGRSLQDYREEFRMSGVGLAHLIIPLYLSAETTPRMIEAGARTGALKAVKYYPPHGTTNSGGAIPLDHLLDGGPKRDVLRAMADHGVILCLHGEAHGLPPELYFDQRRNAETIFYREHAPRVLETEPTLRMVAEHITTAAAAGFVAEAPPHVAATVTPQHLLYTIGDWALTKSNHAICMPLLKFAEDRDVLRHYVMHRDNTKFFAGTDSAPHPERSKAVDCGCAAGCFTGGVAPQLYAMAFDKGAEEAFQRFNAVAFRRFVCDLGAAFYGVAVPPQKTLRLVRVEAPVKPLFAPDGQEIVSLPRGLVPKGQRDAVTLPWRLERIVSLS